MPQSLTAHQSEALLNALMSSGPDDFAVTIFSSDLTVTKINEAAATMSGYTPQQMVGRDIRELVPALADTLDEVLRKTLSGEAQLNVSVTGEVPATPGEVRRWRVSYLPMRDDRDRVTGVVALGVEVTTEMQMRARAREKADAARVASYVQQVLAEDSARSYERALGDYRMLMRHRLANPITVMTGMAETLRHVDVTDQDTRCKMLDAIVEQGRIMEELALDPRAVSAEEEPLRPSPIEWREERLAYIETLFRAANERLRRDIEPREDGDQLLPFACECSELTCAQVLYLDLADYRRVRRSSDTFLLVAGHDSPEIEDIIEEADGFHIAKKRVL